MGVERSKRRTHRPIDKVTCEARKQRFVSDPIVSIVAYSNDIFLTHDEDKEQSPLCDFCYRT